MVYLHLYVGEPNTLKTLHSMAKLQKQTKQNPKLEQRKLKDGRIALYL